MKLYEDDANVNVEAEAEVDDEVIRANPPKNARNRNWHMIVTTLNALVLLWSLSSLPLLLAFFVLLLRLLFFLFGLYGRLLLLLLLLLLLILLGLAVTGFGISDDVRIISIN